MKNQRNALIIFLLLLAGCTWFPQLLSAQDALQQPSQDRKSVGGAFLRSVVLPGWGHRYAVDDWARGRVYAGADVTFLAATLGYHQLANHTRDAMFTAARQFAGVNVEGREKAFQLAVAQYNSLAEYNRTMEQTRNWDRFYEASAENQWEWQSEEDRIRYNALRGKSDDSRRQAGIFVGLMVVNRVVSGVSSMVKVRNRNRSIPSIVLVPDVHDASTRVAASITFRF